MNREVIPYGSKVTNEYQRAHIEGTFDVHAPIPQHEGKPLKPLAVQWYEDFKRRFTHGPSSGRRRSA